MNGVTGIVFAAEPRRPWLAGRSTRSLKRAGLSRVIRVDAGTAMPAVDGPVLLLRAGAWLNHIHPLTPPPRSATGKPLVALGSVLSGKVVESWRATFARCGGDLSRDAEIPPVTAAWFETFERDRFDLRTYSDCRVVHWSPLDVYESDDPDRLRVVQVVTSLQQGGAERVTWDLHDLLPGVGVDSLLVTLGRPLRRALPDPPNRVDLSKLSTSQRMDAVANVAARFGADVIHAHLIRGDDAGQLAKSRVPLVMTAHNMRPGWPDGLEGLRPNTAALVVGCARAVERELIAANVPAPTRTAWNGIDVGAFAFVERRIDARFLTIACVANPRPQKRLHLLPDVLASVRDELASRADARMPRLIVCGELPPGDEPSLASDCIDEMHAAAESLGVANLIEWTNGKRDVRDVLAGADVLLSLSAHEGLSLAHVEALAAGVPVVGTDVGGTGELARGNDAFTLLPVDVRPADAARAVMEATGIPVTQGASDAVRRDFSRERMAARYAWLYRAAVHGPPRGDTLWFVANNLSTGGAQSSLRRLVKALHTSGQRVHVALLQEYAEHPTPGREDLLRAGVPVTVLPPAGTVDVPEAVQKLLGEMCADPPRSVTFWNAIQSYKLHVADALLRVPVFDVSPGEMFYDSLDGYCAKPRGGLPYRSSRDYGERLAGVIVKYSAEAEMARERLGALVHVIPNGVPCPGTVLPTPVSERTREDPDLGTRNESGSSRRTVQTPRRESQCGGSAIIGTAARLHPHKRIEDLIDAFRLASERVPGAVLRIAGGADTGQDDYAAMLRSRAEGRNVEWLGEIANASEFHRDLDLFAMISEPAGCPNASLEAMAGGLPVVATDVGGVSEQVIDGVTGRLLPPRDIPAFAEALVQLAKCAECRARMGVAARRHVEQHFSLERMGERYRAVLASDAAVPTMAS
jgi:glycosyltransferase involved in cell wall biosynthesis